MPEKILVYGHPGCPAVPPVTAMLTQAKVAFDYINIRQQPQSAAQVRAINNGNESVPTLIFPDGSTLTEPSVGELKRKLETMGYRVGPLAWLIGNGWLIVTGLIILFALLRFLEIL
jgi:mycoredoxin